MPIFSIDNNDLSLIKKVDFKKEMELQRLTENNLEELFNLKFIEIEINNPDNMIRDVSNIGHNGVGDYEFKITLEDDFYHFNRLFMQAYDEK